MLLRLFSVFSLAVAATLALACSQPPEKTGRAPASPSGDHATTPAKGVPASPKEKAPRPLQTWARYWLT